MFSNTTVSAEVSIKGDFNLCSQSRSPKIELIPKPFFCGGEIFEVYKNKREELR